MKRTKLPPTPIGDPQADGRNTSLIYELAERIRSHLNRFPFLTTNGRLVEGITITAAGSTKISHGLGRKVKGYFVTYATGSAPELYVSENDATFITLNHAGGSTTVISVWFF